MNEDEVVEGCIPSTEGTFSRNNSKDNIPDAKYYLIRPEDSKTVYIMKEKPPTMYRVSYCLATLKNPMVISLLDY